MIPDLPLLSKAKSAKCSRAFDRLRTAIRKDLSTMVAATLGCESESSDDRTFDVGMVMICALIQTGPDPRKIARVTGIKPHKCLWYSRQLTRAGVFQSGGVRAGEWMDEEGGNLYFVLDAMAGAGQIGYSGAPGPHRKYFSL